MTTNSNIEITKTDLISEVLSNKEKQELVDEMLSLHAEWSTSRGKKGKPAVFKDMNLIDISFADSYLDNVVFINCLLNGADFSGSSMVDALFKGCDLSNARLYKVGGKGAAFINVNAEGAVLEWAEMPLSVWVNTTLEKAAMIKSNFDASYMMEVSFESATGSGVEIRDADLYYMNLIEIDMSDSTVKGSRLYISDSSDTVIPSDVDLTDVKILNIKDVIKGGVGY